MTEPDTDNHNAPSEPEPGSPAPEQPLYGYDNAGITEHGGRVPLWLWLVVIALVIWSVYYLVTYWNAPAP